MSSDLLRVLVPVVLLAGCSVKEDRSACPCTLVLDFSDLPVTPVMLSVEGEGCSVLQIVHADTLMTLSVPRTDLSVSVTGGALPDAAGSVRIPFGEEAPPLYLYHASVPSDAEQVVLPVYLRKQFCRLTLAFTGPPTSSGRYNRKPHCSRPPGGTASRPRRHRYGHPLQRTVPFRA